MNRLVVKVRFAPPESPVAALVRREENGRRPADLGAGSGWRWASAARGRIASLLFASVVAFPIGGALGLVPVRAALAGPAGGQPAEQVEEASAPGAAVRAGLGRALLDAAARGELSAVDDLLNAGADPNAAVPRDGSPLIAAARAGHLAVARRLVDRGARVDAAVPGDGTPLIAAASEGRVEVIRLLLDRGAPINQIAADDENPLIQASARGRLAAVQLLVQRGADVNARAWAELAPGRGEWRTPLGQAQRSGNGAVVEFLRSSGAR